MEIPRSPSRLSLAHLAVQKWGSDMLIFPVISQKQPFPDQPGKKIGDTALTIDRDGKQQLYISLGEEGKLKPAALRKAGEETARWLIEHQIDKAGLQVSTFDSLPVATACEAFCEGMYIGAFEFNTHRSHPQKTTPIKVFLLTEGDRSVDSMVVHLNNVMAGVNLSRQLSHEPPNVINPVTLAARAKRLAKECGLKCTILDEKKLAKMGAGAILAVGQGSKSPSHMIILEHTGTKKKTNDKPIVIVGKTITFDTGGYSVKTTPGMLGMKFDKCGGMSVLGIMRSAAAIKLPIHLVGIIAAAENMISDIAYRPNDIISSLSGKTIEVISTDAEGRLVLSDALTYASTHYQPRALIDLATLTGGVVTALGKVRAGLMSNNEKLAGDLIDAGERTDERLWRLPLDDEYFELIEGSDSDIRNSAGVPLATPIVGGMFLKQFVPDDVPWAHIDIAGTATREIKTGGKRAATGFGVRLVLDYLEHLV